MVDMTNVIEQRISPYEKSICEKCSHRRVCRAIDNQPCFECNQFAEDVVRCKDCKLSVVADPPLVAEQKLVCTKSVNWRAVEPDHFCSYYIAVEMPVMNEKWKG